MIVILKGYVALFVGLVLLKAANLTDLSWWLVLFPFTIALVILGSALIGIALFWLAHVVTKPRRPRHRVASRLKRQAGC
ncbi:hypothetical protein [uncultured Methylobacterium sp.]|jgi:hypothetical protein|uniref:hypothetical protein n=1 Tax=uncultured Methylobacterium sp. TaxID=157278 RepID=UPI0026171BB3|nr:hypothetical protein [uncultured Methylobacterium sp.]